MYKEADDIKSRLIVTTLSQVDFLRPEYFYLENVPGFLRYNLNAIQNGIHRVTGGIEMGGLKFVQRALIDMGCARRLLRRFWLLRRLIPGTNSAMVFCKQATTARPKRVYGFSSLPPARACPCRPCRSPRTTSRWPTVCKSCTRTTINPCARSARRAGRPRIPS